MPKSSGSTLHLVLRVSPTANYGRHTVNVVEEHNAIVRQKSRVTIAKFGAAPASSRIQEFHSQATDGKPTKLYIVHKTKGAFVAYSAPVGGAYKGHLPTTLLDLRPAYYSDADQKPGLWLLLTGPLEPDELNGLVLVSNGRDLVEVMSECRTSTMFVHERRD